MTFDFGIVNYNGGEALLECAASILALGDDVRLLVFDNASADGSADAVERRFPRVGVVRSARNLGYAGALNRMLERMTAEVVVFCNMDLRFDPGWRGAVERALAENPWADGVASLVLETTDPPVVNSTGVRFFADLHPQNLGSGRPFVPGALDAGEVVAAYGAVMCFRRAAIGGLRFDDDYFLFFEETDFFLRFSLLGHRLVFTPDAVVHHHRSLTTRRYSPLKLYYGERNRVTTVFKLLPVWYWPAAFAYSVQRFARLRGEAREAGATGGGARLSAPRIVATILRAWGAAVLRLPATLRKRSAFWRAAPTRPRDALAHVRRNALSASDLSVR